MTGHPTILLVDDDAALLQVLPEMLLLRLEDVVVETCNSAAEALERVAARDYDAIVTDIKMPGMDGLTLLERIHAIRPETPTILITGHGEHDLAVRALRGGAFDFIQKPIDRDYFVASLSRAIRMRAMSREIDDRQATLERRKGQLENLVEEQTRDLREANRLKDQFLATLAHELRNPLAPIRNAVEVMRLRGSDDPTVANAREIVARQVEALGRIVDDLLDLNSISRGKLGVRKRVLDLANCVDQALELTRDFVATRGHELLLQVDDRPLLVEADETRIQQVVANLVHNAAKYTERGGRIEIRAHRDGTDVVLRVSDNGMGIPPDRLRSIFEPFTQGEQSLDRPHGGLGIGLTLVRRLVELHAGRVDAFSEGPGQGAEFVVRLPAGVPARRSAAPPPAEVPANAVAANDAAGGDVAAQAPHPRRVLVIEDNADSRESLRVVLELKGHRVEVAPDGPQGVARGLQEPFDVALVDIGLPGMTGYEVAERLRAQAPGIKLVALTGYGSPNDRDRSQRAGFDAHLLKPVDFDALERLLEREVGERPARTNARREATRDEAQKIG